nr:hypothetical protein Iba_chr05fCG11420 [Ipomoea batatas]
MHIRLKGDDNDVASKQEKFHSLATVKQKACEALTNFLARLCIEEVEVDEMDNKSKTIGKIKSKGMQPNAPNIAMMSPKKGNIAANVVAITTVADRAINRGTTLRIDNTSFFGSAHLFSRTTFDADTCVKVKTFVIKRNHLGSRGFPSTMKFWSTDP